MVAYFREGPTGGTSSRQLSSNAGPGSVSAAGDARSDSASAAGSNGVSAAGTPDQAFSLNGVLGGWSSW